jgi:hypothetical protein
MRPVGREGLWIPAGVYPDENRGRNDVKKTVKGGFLDQGKNRRREKTIKKNIQYNSPGINIE